MKKQVGISGNTLANELKVVKGTMDEVVSAEGQDVLQQLARLFNVYNESGSVVIFSPASRLKNFAKRSFDVIISVLVIIFFLSWLIPVFALLIKLDSRGPVFFFQKRNKKNGKIFRCIKFRTMIVNNEADSTPATNYDKRITRVGRFLRQHYLDELPQFFNVLFDDMSIVGPRPHMLSDNQLYSELIDHYPLRHKVKPGITGLAQVMGYTGSSNDILKMKHRVYLDVFYVRHWSLRLDIKILWHTLRKMIGF
jgi:lipopolysaccharide/colanic/teichoic acid biosynthesis glycosyltransferase